jgi:hypothetical protein
VDSILADNDVKKLNIYNLSDTELINLGFGYVSEDTNVRLIPTWIYQFLPETVYVYGSNSTEPVVIKREQLGEPNAGYFGYGILAKGMKLNNSEPEIEEIKHKVEIE